MQKRHHNEHPLRALWCLFSASFFATLFVSCQSVTNTKHTYGIAGAQPRITLTVTETPARTGDDAPRMLTFTLRRDNADTIACVAPENTIGATTNLARVAASFINVGGETFRAQYFGTVRIDAPGEILHCVGAVDARGSVSGEIALLTWRVTSAPETNTTPPDSATPAPQPEFHEEISLFEKRFAGAALGDDIVLQ